jgi:hypothetical protein
VLCVQSLGRADHRTVHNWNREDTVRVVFINEFAGNDGQSIPQDFAESLRIFPPDACQFHSKKREQSLELPVSGTRMARDHHRLIQCREEIEFVFLLAAIDGGESAAAFGNEPLPFGSPNSTALALVKHPQ